MDRASIVLQSKSQVLSTMTLLSHLKNAVQLSLRLSLLQQLNWSDIDVNIDTLDGLSFYKQLLALLKHAAAANFMESVYYSSINQHGTVDNSSIFVGLQSKIITKLLERSPIIPGSKPARSWTHPLASAAELLQHVALELSMPQCLRLVEFLKQLISALHGLGFNLDTPDAQGRTLLTTYAAACSNNFAGAVDVVRHLLQLGASPSVRDLQGRSLLFVWAQAQRPDLVLAVLNQKGEWAALQVKVDVWEQDADSHTLLEVASAMPQNVAPSWSLVCSVLRQLQHHWVQQERPVQRDLLLECKPLIGDLVDIMLSFMDGLNHQGQPVVKIVAPAAAPAVPAVQGQAGVAMA